MLKNIQIEKNYIKESKTTKVTKDEGSMTKDEGSMTKDEGSMTKNEVTKEIILFKNILINIMNEDEERMNEERMNKIKINKINKKDTIERLE